MNARAARPLAALQVVPSINRDTGGPAQTVTRLAAALDECGVCSTIATLDYARHGGQCATGGAALVSLRAGAIARSARGFSPRFERRLRELSAATDIVHNHGLWMFPNLYAARAARSAGAALVTSPRGMLESWALARGAVKKRMMWRLWQRTALESSALLHATSGQEAEGLRALGLTAPVAIIPNGVDVPQSDAQPPARTLLEDRFPRLRAKRWLLFLSRLHPKKGVLELLDVWGRLARAGAADDWHLVLAGPDLDGFGRVVEARLAHDPLDACVTRTGMLTGDDKECALRNAELFVLPTRSENFGMVIAEALARELPVVTTRAAPWPELESERCGWWIDPTEEALESALRRAMQVDASQRRGMGERGRAFVAARLGWDAVAAQMKGAYDWLAGSGPRPHFIHTA